MVPPGLINLGYVVRSGSAPQERTNGRTFLVSGVARSGTTLVAAVLQEAGLYLGTFLADVVHEDRELLAILQSGQRPLLDEAIARRNAEHRDWGFKVPNLHAFLRHDDLARFRNPHLILIFRDPVAVSVRNGISEMFDPFAMLVDTVNAQQSLIQFLERTDCPCLLSSYEKALIFPDGFVTVLTDFCGISPDAETRQRMIRIVQPNPDDYVQAARRQFAGAIDILQDDMLLGWCCQLGELEPVVLDVFLGKHRVATVKADRFRHDLLKAGFGNGNHGFCVDVAPFNGAKQETVRLVVAGRTYEVPRSGSALSDFESKAPEATATDLPDPGFRLGGARRRRPAPQPKAARR